jgi:hypothetical protein
LFRAVAAEIKGISWEEWVLRSPCDSDEDDDGAAFDPEGEGEVRPRHWNGFDLDNNAWDQKMGLVTIMSSHADPKRLRYLEKHVHADVLASMCAWDHTKQGATPNAVGDIGMLWLQRFLVGRDAVRRHGIEVPDFGPKGYFGLVDALGVVCFRGQITRRGCAGKRIRAGEAFVVLYTRALRARYSVRNTACAEEYRGGAVI